MVSLMPTPPAKQRYQTVVCSRCGRQVTRANVPIAERPTFVCGQCKRARPLRPCRYCGKPTTGTYCDSECYGALSRGAETLGVSRERMRQLVEAYHSQHGGTRRDALTAILAAREGRENDATA